MRKVEHLVTGVAKGLRQEQDRQSRLAQRLSAAGATVAPERPSRLGGTPMANGATPIRDRPKPRIKFTLKMIADENAKLERIRHELAREGVIVEKRDVLIAGLEALGRLAPEKRAALVAATRPANRRVDV